ncbi:MAG: SGNH/GDSL hydrolase family protein [Butyricicoccus sp.]
MTERRRIYPMLGGGTGAGGNVQTDLSTKKAVFIGDSMSQGYGNNGYSFVDIFAEHGDFQSIKKYAVGGATLEDYSSVSEASGYDCYHQIVNHSADIAEADLLFLQFCHNDIQSVVKGTLAMGVASDAASVQTVCGALQKCIEKVYEINPEIRIIYLNHTNSVAYMRELATAYYTAYGTVSEGAVGQMVLQHIFWQTQAMQKLEDHNIQVINVLDDTGVGDLTMSNFLTSDGFHCTTPMHQMIYECIKARIFTASPPVAGDDMTGFVTNVGSDNAVVSSDTYVLYGLTLCGLAPQVRYNPESNVYLMITMNIINEAVSPTAVVGYGIISKNAVFYGLEFNVLVGGSTATVNQTAL